MGKQQNEKRTKEKRPENDSSKRIFNFELKNLNIFRLTFRGAACGESSTRKHIKSICSRLCRAFSGGSNGDLSERVVVAILEGFHMLFNFVCAELLQNDLSSH